MREHRLFAGSQWMLTLSNGEVDRLNFSSLSPIIPDPFNRSQEIDASPEMFRETIEHAQVKFGPIEMVKGEPVSPPLHRRGSRSIPKEIIAPITATATSLSVGK